MAGIVDLPPSLRLGHHVPGWGVKPGRNTQAADRDQPWYWMPAGPWLPVLPFLGGEQPLPGFVWQADEVDGDAEVLEGLGGPRIGGWHERGVRLADRRGTAAAGAGGSCVPRSRSA